MPIPTSPGMVMRCWHPRSLQEHRGGSLRGRDRPALPVPLHIHVRPARLQHPGGHRESPRPHVQVQRRGDALCERAAGATGEGTYGCFPYEAMRAVLEARRESVVAGGESGVVTGQSGAASGETRLASATQCCSWKHGAEAARGGVSLAKGDLGVFCRMPGDRGR